MDFFEAQEQAKRRTGLLVLLFGTAMVALAVGLYLAILLAVTFQAPMEEPLAPGGHLMLFLGVAVVTWAAVGLASLFRTSQLRQGGSKVAQLLGGRQVSHDTSDLDEQRLVNVVEEMAIASGTPVPAIFVLDQESSINAFAAGYSIHDAAVAVTRGTLEKLNRDELQGVIAHEFSHILNGDMRLNIRLMGLLFGILFLTIIGRGVLRGGAYSRRSRGGGQAMFIGLALILLGFLGVFFGRLIKAAVSRQREFLADAAAVQFTRNPGGIGGALKKIADHPSGGKIEDHHAEEASHLFFADGLGSAFSRAMATHPPLKERIRRIDPSRTSVGHDAHVRSGTDAGAAAEAPAGAGRAGPGGGDLPAPERMAGILAGAAVLMGSVGAPAPEHVAYARRLRERIPERLRDASHDPEGAQALVLALLGNGDERVAGARREAARSLGLEGVDELLPLVEAAGPEARLPLLDMALPALRTLEGERASALRSGAQQVIRADGELRPFDLALVHILWRHLSRGTGRQGERGRTISSLGPLRGALEILLSAVARSGADDEEAAREAFEAGLARLPQTVAEAMSLRPPQGTRLSELDEGLGRLERGALEVRRQVLEACAAAVLADREVRTAEMELLRAVAESLELPLPPILGGQPAPTGERPSGSAPADAAG